MAAVETVASNVVVGRGSYQTCDSNHPLVQAFSREAILFGMFSTGPVSKLKRQVLSGLRSPRGDLSLSKRCPFLGSPWKYFPIWVIGILCHLRRSRDDSRRIFSLAKFSTRALGCFVTTRPWWSLTFCVL